MTPQTRGELEAWGIFLMLLMFVWLLAIFYEL